ncbi:MAG: hypothetical protein K0R90_1535, partial [Oscillospiraceae bacterium]|nr:hypothetical protein [Oscillospiraceae bacterium]
GHNTDGKGCTILCSAIEKNMIDSYISIFKESGIEINSIDIGLNCVIKLLKYFKNLSKQTYILLGLDANNMVSLLFADGKYHISNRNRLLSERGTSESISEIVRVVSSLIQFNKSQKNESDISCTYFCGLRENEKWLNHQVSNSLNIQSTPFPMGQAVSVKRKIAQKGILQGNYLYAIGNLITK